MYKNANHGFHNDSTGRYNDVNAELAWQRTLAFFNQHIS
jgi:carboxymethylenebutenolidase